MHRSFLNGSPNKASNCERKILVYSDTKKQQQQNKPGLITILYIKNSNEGCFIGFKAPSHNVLLVS